MTEQTYRHKAYHFCEHMRTGQTSVIYLISKFTGSVLGFIATIYFARLLGEEILGYYGITLAVVSWLGIIGSVGFGQAIIKRISEGKEPEAYLTAGLLIKGSLLTTVSFGVFAFREQLNSYVGAPVSSFVVLILFSHFFLTLVKSSLQGYHLVHIYAPLSTAKEGIRSATMIFLVYFGWELSGMLFGYATGTILVSLIGIWIIKPHFTTPNIDHFKSLFNFAKFSWLGSMQKKTFSDVDILVLGVFVSAGFTGVYVVAYSLAKFLDIFASALQTTLFPELSKLSAIGDTDMIRTLTNDALTYAGLFVIPGIIGSAILGDRLMRVYGPGFEIGAQVLTILLVGILAYSYNKQLLNTLNAIDRPDLAFRSNIVFILTNVTLNVALIYTYGWIGAAVATALSAFVGFIFSFYYTKAYVQFHVPYREMIFQWIAAIGMGVLVYWARIYSEPSWLADYNTPFVVSLVGLGALAYFSILFTISSTFRQTISRNIPLTIPLISK